MSETASIASSQRTNNSGRFSSGLKSLYHDFPIFPLLLSLESTYHRVLSYLNLIIRFFQIFAFVANPHFMTSKIDAAVWKAVYWSHIPLWDHLYMKGTLGWHAYIWFWGIGVLYVILPLIIVLGVLVSRTPMPHERGLCVVLRAWFHSMTSVLFIPLMQSFLSQIITSKGDLWSFPGIKALSSPGMVAVAAFSIIALVLLSCTTFILQCTVAVDDYLSQHILARMHYLVDLCDVAWRIITCVVFQGMLSLIASGILTDPSWFALYLCLSTFIMLCLEAGLLPYIYHSTTRIICCVYTFICIFALILFIRVQITGPASSTDESGVLNLAVQISVGIVFIVLLVGWKAADARVNRELTESLPQLSNASAAYPSTYTCLFPNGLPEYDVVYRVYSELCAEVADGAMLERRSFVSLEIPFLTNIRIYTDVEVATRFHVTVWQHTKLYPTPEMLHLASRIFAKGQLRFKGSVSVLLSFASMIRAFTSKRSLALLQCEKANTMECSFSTRYKAYRMMSRLRFELQVRDVVFQHSCDKAKRAHKEILVRLHQFWNRLLTQQERTQIFYSYSDIAQVRDETNAMFLNALEHPHSDRGLLLKYADFLQEVMLEPELAEKLRTFAENETEEQRRSQGKESKNIDQTAQERRRLLHSYGGNSSSNGRGGGVGGDKSKSFSNGGGNASSRFRISSLLSLGIHFSRNNIIRVVLTLALVALAVVYIIMIIVTRNRRESAIRCVDSSATARTFRMLGDVVAMEYWTMAQGNTGDYNFDYLGNGPRLNFLRALAKDMLALQNTVVFNTSHTISGISEEILYSPRILYLQQSQNSSIPLVSVSSLLGLNYRYAEFLDGLPVLFGHQYANTYVDVPLVMNSTFAWLTNSSVHGWESSAYNASVQLCLMRLQEETNLTLIIFTVLLGIGFIYLIIYAEMLSLASAGELLRDTVVTVFSHVPRPRVQQLAQEAKLRVEQFDRNDTEDDAGFVTMMSSANVNANNSNVNNDNNGNNNTIDGTLTDNNNMNNAVSTGSNSNMALSSMKTTSSTLIELSSGNGSKSNAISASGVGGNRDDKGSNNSKHIATGIVDPYDSNYSSENDENGLLNKREGNYRNREGDYSHHHHHHHDHDHDSDSESNSSDSYTKGSSSLMEDQHHHHYHHEKKDSEKRKRRRHRHKHGYASSHMSRREVEKAAMKREIARHKAWEVPKVRRIDYIFVIVLIFVLVGLFCVATLFLVRHDSNFKTMSTLFDRCVTYNTVISSLHETLWEVLVLFATGVKPEKDWVATANVLRQGLLPTLTSFPSTEEVNAIRNVTVQIEQVINVYSVVSEFETYPSQVTSLYNTTSNSSVDNPLGEEARTAMFDFHSGFFIDYYNNVFATLRTTLELALNETSSQNDGNNTYNTSLINASLSLSCVAVVLVMLISFSLYRRFGSHFLRGHSTWVLLVFSLTILACMAMTCAAYIQSEKLHQSTNKLVDLLSEQGLVKQSYMWPLMQAGVAAQQGHSLNPVIVHNYFTFINSDYVMNSFVQERLTTEQAIMANNTLQELQYFEKIALTLLSQSFIEHTDNLTNFTWDFDSEADAMTTRVNYPNDPLRYTNTSYDVKLPINVTILKARDVLSNDRVKDTLSTMENIWENVYSKHIFEHLNTIHSLTQFIQRAAITVLVCAFVCLLLATTFIIFALFQYSEQSREFDRITKGIVVSKHTNHSKWYSLMIIALFMCATYITIVYINWVSNHTGVQLDIMHSRAFVYIESMIAAEEWIANVISKAELNSWLEIRQQQLKSLTQSLQGGFNSIYNINPTLDNFLQGVNVVLPSFYTGGFDISSSSSSSSSNSSSSATSSLSLEDAFSELTSSSSSSSSWYSSTDSSDSSSGNSDTVLAYGMEESVSAWSEYMTSLRLEADVSRAQNIVKTMRESFMGLEQCLEYASNLLFNAQSNNLHNFAAIQIILSVCVLLCVVGVHGVVFLLEAREEMRHMLAYRMLVKLIPADVQESIPATHEARELGLEHENEAINDYTHSVSDVITVPVIAINDYGIVILFNRFAEEVFGYAAAEVLGNEVTILMPDRIAAKYYMHMDMYRSTHAEPITQQLLRNLEVHGRTKNGTLIELRLSLQELRCHSGDRVFIGFVEDISDLVKRQRELEMNAFLQEELPQPMIAIDTLGAILRFNKAAEACFGRSAADVMDQNVKILMPEEVAARHDSYLATYLRTRQRHVLANVNRVRAVRKNGEEFPAELVVKELLNDNVTTYLGFIRDLSSDADMDEAMLLKSILMESLSLAVICTDITGRVILYSNSAESIFGFAPEEVVNNNCKMLMPPAIGDKYDTYLERYRNSLGQRATLPLDQEWMGRHKDGHLIPLEITWREVQSPNSAYLALLGFVREISDAREKKKRRLMEEIIMTEHHTPIVWLREDGTIVKVNRATEEEFGFSAEELLQENVKRLLPPHCAKCVRPQLPNGPLSLVGVPAPTTGNAMPNTSSTANSTFTNPKAPFARNSVQDSKNRQTSPGAHRHNSNSNSNSNTNNEKDRKVAGNSDSQAASAVETGTDSRWFIAMRKSGSTFPVEAKMRAITSESYELAQTNQNGESIFTHSNVIFVTYLRNITTEMNSDRSGALNNFIIEASLVPMLRLDGDGVIIQCNEAMEKLLSLRHTDLVGRRLDELLVYPRSAVSAINISSVFNSLTDHIDNIPLPESTSSFLTTRTTTTNAGDNSNNDINNEGEEFYDDNGGDDDDEDNDQGKRSILTCVNKKVIRFIRASDMTSIPVEITIKGILPSTKYDKMQYAVHLRDTRNDGALEQERALSQTIAELAPIPLVQFSWTSKVVVFNEAAHVKFEWNALEVIDKDVSMLFVDANTLYDLLPHDKESAAQVAEAKNRVYCTQGKTKSGKTFPMLVSIREIVVEHDRTQNTFVAYFNDLTSALQLQASCQTLQAYLHLNYYCIMVLRKDNTIIACNEATLNAFHYSSEVELMGKPIAELLKYEMEAENTLSLTANKNAIREMAMHADLPTQDEMTDAHNFAEAYLKANELGFTDLRTRVVCTRADRTFFAGQVRVIEINDTLDGTFYVCRVIDCSERAKVDYGTRLLQCILQISPDPMFAMDESGTIKQASLSTAQSFGYNDANEMIGLHVDQLIKDVNAVSSSAPSTSNTNVVDNTTKDESNSNNESTHTDATRHGMLNSRKRAVLAIRKDLSTFTAEFGVHDIELSDQHLYVGQLFDTTAMNNLHAQRKLNMAVIEHSPVPVLIISSKGVIKLFSPAAEKFFGYPATDMVGSLLSSLVASRASVFYGDSEESTESIQPLTENTTATNNSNNINASSINNRHVASDELPLLIEGNARCARLRNGEIVPIQTFFRSYAELEDTSAFKWTTRNNNSTASPGAHTNASASAGATNESSKSASSLTSEEKANEQKRSYSNKNADNLANDNESSIVVFIVDRRNEYAIEKARRLCSAVIRGLPVPYVVISHAQIILRTSINITSFLGYTSSELVGQHISVIAPRDALLRTTPSVSPGQGEINSLSDVHTMDLSLIETNMYGSHVQPTNTSSIQEENNNNNNSNCPITETRHNVHLLTKAGTVLEVDVQVCEVNLNNARKESQQESQSNRKYSTTSVNKVYYIMLLDVRVIREYTRCTQRCNNLINYISTPLILLQRDSDTQTSSNNNNNSNKGGNGKMMRGQDLLRRNDSESELLTVQMINTAAESFLNISSAMVKNESASNIFVDGAMLEQLVQLFDLDNSENSLASSEHDINDQVERRATVRVWRRRSQTPSQLMSMSPSESFASPSNAAMTLYSHSSKRFHGGGGSSSNNSLRDESSLMEVYLVEMIVHVIDSQRMLVQLKDNTEEERRRVSRVLFQALHHTIKDPCMVINAKDDMVALNKAAEALLGYSINTLNGGRLFAPDIIEGGVVSAFARISNKEIRGASHIRTNTHDVDHTSHRPYYYMEEEREELEKKEKKETQRDIQNTSFDDSCTSNNQSSMTTNDTLSDHTETHRAHSELRHAQQDTTESISPHSIMSDRVEESDVESGNTNITGSHNAPIELNKVYEQSFYLDALSSLACMDGLALQLCPSSVMHSEVPYSYLRPRLINEEDVNDDERRRVEVRTRCVNTHRSCKRVDGKEMNLELRLCEVRLLNALHNNNNNNNNELEECYYLVFVTDSHTERELKENTQLAKVLVARSPDATIMSDANGIITYLNTAAEHLFMFSSDQIIGRAMDVLFARNSETQREKFVHRFTRLCKRAASEQKNKYNGVLREALMERRSGELFQAYVHVEQVCDENGETSRFISHFKKMQSTNMLLR